MEVNSGQPVFAAKPALATMYVHRTTNNHSRKNEGKLVKMVSFCHNHYFIYYSLFFLVSMMNRGILSLFVVVFLIQNVLASNVTIWQGQYFIGSLFQQGTFQFNFTVYGANVGGARRATLI